MPSRVGGGVDQSVGSAYCRVRETKTPVDENALLVALDLTSDGAMILSEEGVIRYVNAAQEQMCGYLRQDLEGRNISHLLAIGAKPADDFLQVIFDEIGRNGAWSGQWPNRRQDGSVSVLTVRIRMIDWCGERHWLVLQHEHLVERLEKPDDPEGRFAIAAEAAELGVWEWDVPANAFVYSARARIICGLPLTGEVTYEDVVRVTHPEDFPRTSGQANRAFDPAIRSREAFEYRLVRPDGSLRWVRAYGYAMFTDASATARALRYIGTLEDITDRVTARRAETEAARQVHLALESARMAVWSLDVTNGVIASSREFNQLFGFHPDAQPTLDEVEACYAPGVKERLIESWTAAHAARSPNFETEYMIRRSGEDRAIFVRCDISYASDGGPERAFGIVMDVTEAQRARRALRESDARFVEAANSAPAPVWMTDADGRVEFANEAMVKFAGLARQETMGDRWLALIHPDDLPAVIAARQRAWNAGYQPYTFEARFRRADGDWRLLEVNSRPRRGQDGNFKGYVGLAVDRTEAQRAMAEVAESEERFRLLADSAPVMIWMSDPDGGCVYLNAALRRFWSVAPGDIATFDWRTRMHPEDEARITQTVVEATRLGRSFSVAGRYLNAEDVYRHVETTGEPRFSASGRLMGMIGVNVDMTDVVNAQSRQKVLLDELNHRVKNTLTVVQSLARQTFRSGREIESASAVFDARLRALAAAHTLLTMSNWESAPVHSIAEQAVQPCGERRGQIVFDGASTLLSPRLALSVSLALHELCTNAVKYGALSTDEGRVSLSWRIEPGGWFQMEWRERSGAIVSAPPHRSFGSRLLEKVVPQDVRGNAQLVFEPEGVRYILTAPIGEDE